ncbi:MAG: PKD domain-containing protein, partial [Schleiferiaceae bacterium]|nr:PKD domain-containing protein [Schleiferiaceae bacterium]
LANWTAEIISTGPLGMAVEFNGNVSLGASYYKWYFGDGDSGVGKVITHTYNPPGLFYNVTLIASNDCNGSDIITKSLTTIGTFEEGISQNKIWPTILKPGGKLYLTNRNALSTNKKIKIIDSLGRLMKDYQISDGIEIPEHWPRGTYFLRFDNETFKFLLMN